MKKLAVLLMFIFSVGTVFSIDMKLSYERLDVDFNGVVNSEHSIICYGTGSIILKSYDNGDTWEQECIHHDSLDITKMIFRNDQYYALLPYNYIVIGDKDANNWKSIYTGVTYQRSFVINDNKIFILGLNSIFVFENNSLKDEIILLDTNGYTELELFNDKLIVATMNGKLISIDLSDNYYQELIDFSKLGLCSSCGPLRRMKIDNNKLYLSHEWDVFVSLDLINWDMAAVDISLSEIKDGSVFDLRAASTKYLNAALLELSIAGQDSNIKISNDWQQRNVNILAFIDYKFCNDSIVVATGRDKLIAVSKDAGVNWELKSNYTGYGFKVVTDSLLYSIRSRGRIYKTTNAGATWLPPLFSDTLVRSFNTEDYSEFDENGYGFVYADGAYTTYFNFLFTYDYGNTYELKLFEHLNGYMGGKGCSFIKTSSGYNVLFPRRLSKKPLTTVITIDTAFNFVSRYENDSINIISLKNLDANICIGIAPDMKWPYYSDGVQSDSNNYLIMFSYDEGLTWEKDFEIFMADTALKPNMNIYDSNLFLGGIHWYKEPKDIPNVNQFYLIDMETHERTRIFNDIVSSYGDITEYKDYLMFGGWEYLFVNTDVKKEPLNWIKLPFQGKYIMSVTYKFDKFWSQMFDIRSRQTHQYKVNLDLITDVTEEIEEKTYLYSFTPYPNPASDYIEVCLDGVMLSETKEPVVKIYDVLGNVVVSLGDSRFRGNDMRDSEGEKVRLDVSALSPGVYFVRVCEQVSKFVKM